MPPASLKQLCDLVSDVAITSATALRQKLTDLVTPYAIDLDPEHILKTFAFMNWTFAQGVWSNLQNTQLRHDLQVELKEFCIIKLAQQLCGSAGVDEVAAKAVFLTENFNSYVMGYTNNMQTLGYADAGTARIFALERIQEEYGIDDDVMSDIVRFLWSDEEANSEVESVAMQVNKTVADMKPKGFFRRLFGG